MIVMTDKDFLDAAEKVLDAIEACCDDINEHTEADIDNLRNGNAVTLAFTNKSQIVVNLQKPIHEIWLASQAGGYHFTLGDDGLWHDSREGLELFSALSSFASQQSGVTVQFHPV
jgi:CyaY protein